MRPEERRKRNAARSKLRYAVRIWDVPKPYTCEGCGNRARRLQAHHKDYDKPLEVVWLCRQCHGLAHRKPIIYEPWMSE